jgi:hypothetical protein
MAIAIAAQLADLRTSGRFTFASALNHHRLEAIGALIGDLEQLRAHARVPELVDVVGHALELLGFRLGGEEGGDLVGLVTQLVRRHRSGLLERSGPAG